MQRKYMLENANLMFFFVDLQAIRYKKKKENNRLPTFVVIFKV